MNLCEEMFLDMNMALDGELTAERSAELDAHCAICPHCATLFHQLQQMQLAMVEMDEIAPSEGFKNRVLEKIAREGKKKVVPFPARWRQLATAAACGVLCVGLYQMGLFSGDTESASTTSVTMSYGSAMTTEMAVGELGQGGEEMAIPRMAEMDTTAEQETETMESVADATTFSLDELVAQDLEVEYVRWIMARQTELPEILPEEVPSLDGWTTLKEGVIYCQVSEPIWQEMRILLGFGISQVQEDDSIPCTIIIIVE